VNDILFSCANMTALVGWCLLIFVPRWRGVAQAVASVAVPTLLSVAYAALIGVWWSRTEGGFGSLEEVHALFQTPGALLAGWIHYLAFDLFVGAWIARECRREGVPHLVVIPILILTFLFGPMGYLASLIVRRARRIWTPEPDDMTGKSWIARALGDFVRRGPRLMASAFVCFAMMAPLAFAAAIEDRTFQGANLWFKPLKFHVSTGIYLATLGFFLPMTSDAFRRSRAGRFVVWGSIVMTALELIYITWRASRAEASHFNSSTRLAQALYALMGIAALTLAATGPTLAWGVARADAKPAHPTYRLAVFVGLLLSFCLGTASAVVMSVGPGHFIGTPPAGGSIVPLVGWSRTVGDLRVAHFMGLHAQQVVAIVGFFAAAWLGKRGALAVIGFAGLYSIVVAGLFLQALAGQPFVPG
jgi:hypothetical protein